YRPAAFACQISIIASGTGNPSPSMTRPSIVMRSPAGPALVRSPQSGRARPRWKNGPTVCDGVGISFSAIADSGSGRIDWRRCAAAQNQIETIAQRPLRLAQVRVVSGDQPLTRRGIGSALKDRVERQERIAGKIHLGDNARHKAGAENAEVKMCRTPCVRRVPPGIGAGFDGQEAIISVFVSHRLTNAGKVGIERRIMLVDRVVIPAGSVALPQFDQGTRDRVRVLVKDAAGDNDPLSDGFTLMLPGKIRHCRP